MDEKQAFQDLETAMINASLAKKDRLEIVNEVDEAVWSLLFYVLNLIVYFFCVFWELPLHKISGF